jgi:hypothetical protein
VFDHPRAARVEFARAAVNRASYPVLVESVWATRQAYKV